MTAPFEGDADTTPSTTGAPGDDTPGKAKGVFMDPAQMKANIRASMTRPKYDVSEFYKPVGLWSDIARSGLFEKVTLSVIAFNALWISIDTDLNKADMLLNAREVFQIAEHSFCIYFSFEWTVRFMAFRRKRDGLKDAWFVFDSSLVFTMVAETWVMTIIMLASSGSGSSGGLGDASILRMARLLRLSRMARMARLFRAMPELLIMIKGIASAMRSVFFCLVLLAVLIYVFGIALVQLTADSAPLKPYFGSMFVAMHTLLLDGTLLDSPGHIIRTLGDQSYMFAFIFYVFILLSALTLMNMLIGVLCEVVSAVAAAEREKLTISFVQSQLEMVMQSCGLDEDEDGEISKAEFSKIIENPTAFRALEEVGVDVCGLIDNIDFIFHEEDGEEKSLDFPAFVDLMLELRGTNTATVKDIVELRKYIRTAVGGLREDMRVRRQAVAMEGSVPPGGDGDEPSCSAGGWESGHRPASPEAAPPLMPQAPAPRSRHHAAVDDDDPLSLWGHRQELVEALISARVKLFKFIESMPPQSIWVGGGIPGMVEDENPEVTTYTSMPLTQSLWEMPGSPGAGNTEKMKDLYAHLWRLQDSLDSGLSGLQQARDWMYPAARGGSAGAGATAAAAAAAMAPLQQQLCGAMPRRPVGLPVGAVPAKPTEATGADATATTAASAPSLSASPCEVGAMRLSDQMLGKVSSDPCLLQAALEGFMDNS